MPLACINWVAQFRKSIFDKLERKDANRIWLRASLCDVKRVVIINSASRSGSSLLAAIIKMIPGIYSLSGESVPFYKLNCFSRAYFGSDESVPDVPLAPGQYFNLSRDFLSDFSSAENKSDIFRDGNLISQYIDDLTLRFPLQWPVEHFSYALLKRLIAQAFDGYRKRHRNFCKEEFYLDLLCLLRREYKTINPYYYDIPRGMIMKKFPGLGIPSAPPNDIITIEEPPFILLSPSGKINPGDLASKTLLLKTTVDCYRMRFVESLFPEAQIKIIYLGRNPLGCINGLYDGWLHRGFFSHNLRFFTSEKNRERKMLKISGYSDRYEWGKWWWNYDLPPGWEMHTQKRLEEVCAFQWYSANRAIQEYLNNSKREYCLVKYENIIRDLKSRIREISKIVDFIGMPEGVIDRLGLDILPVIQVTEPPEPYRWKKKQGMLLPLIDNPEISKMCGQIGYPRDDIKEWF